MPLQNRVTPMGDIVAEPERGMFTGNRGIIHDPLTALRAGYQPRLHASALGGSGPDCAL